MKDLIELAALHARAAELEARIESLRDYVMSPAERFEQRVSFVFGQQDYDNPNPLTKDEIRHILLYGLDSPTPKEKTQAKREE